MTYYILCGVVFVAAYAVNMFVVTVLYHRGFTHGAVRLSPFLKSFAIHWGNWLTGLDPKGWSCMHRMHHTHSDTELDPHSPHHYGVIGVLRGQLKSYKRVLAGLQLGRKQYTSVVPDLDFSISWLNRKKLWWLPYVVHAAIGVVIGFAFNAWLLGYAYWLGMMSHPIQGWLVNAFGHRYGYRNFETDDKSVNNTFVAWFVMGEGYQNNHHHNPASPNFAAKWFEFDMGYGMCLVARAFGLLDWEKGKFPYVPSKPTQSHPTAPELVATPA